MSRITDEARAAMGLPPEPDEKKEPGVFQNATGAMAQTLIQLSQQKIYADMHAASMDDKFSESQARGHIVTETTTRRVSSRRVPDIEIDEPTVDDYDFVPGT